MKIELASVRHAAPPGMSSSPAAVSAVSRAQSSSVTLRDIDVTLIDRRNHNLFQLHSWFRIPGVAGGHIPVDEHLRVQRFDDIYTISISERGSRKVGRHGCIGRSSTSIYQFREALSRRIQRVGRYLTRQRGARIIDERAEEAAAAQRLRAPETGELNGYPEGV